MKKNKILIKYSKIKTTTEITINAEELGKVNAMQIASYKLQAE